MTETEEEAERGRESVSLGPDPDTLSEEERAAWYGPTFEKDEHIDTPSPTRESYPFHTQPNGSSGPSRPTPPVPPRQPHADWYT